MSTEGKRTVSEKVLLDDAYYESLITDIKRATRSIELESYIFADDEIGREIASVLSAAARRGVRVRILVDGMGTPSWGGELRQGMEKACVQTRVYHPLPWTIKHLIYTRPKTPMRLKLMHLFNVINKRNHRKMCMIDDKAAYIGSANISNVHLRKEKGGGGWRDTTIKIEGVDTRQLKFAFEKAWNHFPIYERAKKTFEKVPKNPRFRLNYLRRQRRILYKDMLNRIFESRKRVWITNAYFIPDAILLKNLIDASERGVDVKIILPEKSDVIIYPLISRYFYSKLLKAGIAIYEYKENMLHAKIIMIDDWYLVGSSNLNYRSSRHDLELDVRISTAEAKEKLEKQFEIDLRQSRKIALEYIRKIPWYKKFTAWLALNLQYWS